MFCPKCGKKMKNIMTFELNRSYQFNRCQCGFVTKHKRIHFEDFAMEHENQEILQPKRKNRKQSQRTYKNHESKIHKRKKTLNGNFEVKNV